MPDPEDCGASLSESSNTAVSLAVCATTVLPLVGETTMLGRVPSLLVVNRTT